MCIVHALLSTYIIAIQIRVKFLKDLTQCLFVFREGWLFISIGQFWTFCYKKNASRMIFSRKFGFFIGDFFNTPRKYFPLQKTTYLYRLFITASRLFRQLIILTSAQRQVTCSSVRETGTKGPKVLIFQISYSIKLISQSFILAFQSLYKTLQNLECVLRYIKFVITNKKTKSKLLVCLTFLRIIK